MAASNSTGASSSAIAHFPAAISKRDLYRAEQTAESWGVMRRTAYAALTRSSKQLVAGIKDERTAGMDVLDAVENISKYLQWREEETKMLTAARARLLIALQIVAPTIDAAPKKRSRRPKQTA